MEPSMMRAGRAIAAALLLLLALAAPLGLGAQSATLGLPKEKQTTLGLYVSFTRFLEIANSQTATEPDLQPDQRAVAGELGFRPR
jgi:hypothetical protein